MLGLTVALIADTVFYRIYSINPTDIRISELRYVFFLSIACVILFVQYPILRFIKLNTVHLTLRLKSLHILVSLVQLSISTFFVILITEIITKTSYSLIEVIAIASFSYTLTMIMMSLLTYKFLSWFALNKNFMIIMYACSTAAVVANTGFTLALVDSVLFSLPPNVPDHIGTAYTPFSPPGSLPEFLENGYVLSSILSFALMWISTMFLLRHHSTKWGKFRFYSFLGIPLVYYLAQFFPFFPTLMPSLFQSNAVVAYVVYYIVFTFSKPIGAILFGLAFWTMARTLESNSTVRNYIGMAALGLVALFISNQALSLILIPYPPFGLASVSFLGMGSYLVFVGVYCSAIAIAQDITIRNSIRATATKLLDGIGTAHMEQEIVGRVARVTQKVRDSIVEESGVPSALEEEDIKDYTRLVLEELKKAQKGEGLT
jgi:hypothetical protein